MSRKKALQEIELDSAKSKKTTGKKTVEEIYQKKSQLEHILLRPDTYIGSVETIQTPMWVYENDTLVFRQISYVPGLYKIFDEIIVNDKSMNTIKVVIDKENNLISVYNNGRGIPVKIHKEEGVYVPEMIFGHLLTSSNYDDNEKKVTGGRNGYGAKLCNIFSTEFVVETADSASGHKYRQVFSNNMGKKGEPVITENAKDEDFTKITFKPDLAKFGMTHIDDDLEALLKKRVYDLAGCVRGVNVFLNGYRIKVKDFKSYVDMYVSAAQQSPESSGAVSRCPVLYERVNDRWEVAVTASDGQFQQVSFVNSICTSKGGNHVTHATDQIVASLLEVVKKKEKKNANIKPFQVKNHLWIFVNTLIENPSFDSQTKENMTLKQSAFGSKCAFSEDFMKKVAKSGIVESILSDVRLRQEKALKKSDGHKTTRISGLAKLDDANNAGTRNGSKCTLILTEGDSAKTLAVSGLSVVGRDNYGVFPLRGKLLNVREATHSQIMANAEINAIKQILGLQHGKQYTSTDSLRYGHLMIMTDQDHDGSHIKGLIINFIDHFWPSLMKIPNFLLEFITPIVKVTKGEGKNKREFSFFTLPEYEEWKKENNDGKDWKIKYYKGLGTSTREEAKTYFSQLAKYRKPFKVCNEEERALVDMAFNKKKADDRKEWLRQCKPGTFMDNSVDEIPISDFVNKELILFSMADNARSIPNVVDGLKPGQRKIMYACFKRKLKHEIKVAQLSGYVAEHSAYHHGEQSLASTIIGLAQNFVGSNNMNLLEPNGQFGTRLQGGKDAASPRYIFTSLSPLARTVYHQADDALLKYLNDDGQSIEPEWYIPILPLVLVNGAEGIGTGWSTSIPNYKLMEDEPVEKMHPWYRGYTGSIESIGADKYRVSGIIRKIDSNTVEVTELPLRSWTQNYKEMLEEWVTGTEKTPACIKDYKEYHTDSSVHFVITMTDEQMKKAESEGLEKKFKINTTITTSNMVCFDSEGRIRKYESVESILQDFYNLRLKYYQMRKEYLLEQMTHEWTKCDNKVRFVTEIIEGELVVQNKKKKDLMVELKKRGYAPLGKKAKTEASDEADEEEEDNEEEEEELKADSYSYLLSMPIWNLTWEKVQQLIKERDEKAEQVKYLSAQSPKSLWKADLEHFMIQWEEFLVKMEELDSQTNKAKPKKAIARKAAYEDEDDSEDDFSAKKVTKPKAKAEPKPKPKAEVKPKAAPKAKPKKKKQDSDEEEEDDDDDQEYSFEKTETSNKGKKRQASTEPKPKARVTKKAKSNEATDDEAPAKPKKQETLPDLLKAKASLLSSKLAKFIDDDDEDEVEVVAVKKPTQKKLTDFLKPKDQPKPVAKAKAKSKIVDTSSEGEEEEEREEEKEVIPAKSAGGRKRAAAASSFKYVMQDESDEEDENASSEFEESFLEEDD